MRRYRGRRNQRFLRVLAAAVIFLAALAVGCGLYARDYYHADAAALAALEPDSQVTVVTGGDTTVFAPVSGADRGFVFYPGGKVEHTAYAPLLRVLSVYGSRDGVLNLGKYEEYQSNLPASASEAVLDGGNHAGFGSYGPQDGDGTPGIPAEQQIEPTVELLMGFFEGTD